MQVGERSDPVRSDFGFHVIEVMEIKPEVAVPLDEVRDELVNQLLAQERNDLFYEQSESLASIAFEQPDSLQGVASATGLEIRQTDWIERDGSGEGIAGNNRVIEAAFSEDVLQNGNNSTPIELATDHLVVIRVLDHQQASQQPLEAVRSVVRQRLVDIKTSEQAEAAGTALLDRLASTGTALPELATEAGFESVTTPMVTRNVSDPPREILATAFSMPLPAEGTVTREGRRLANGDYLVIALQKAEAGSLDKLPEAARTQAWRALSRVQGEAEMAAVLRTLRDQAVVVIPESEDL
jgi:peptidyl-prolyl cis-trans isomerase D